MSLQTIDTMTLKQWLDAGTAILLDVREPSEYKAEHIAGARLIPLAQLSKSSLSCCDKRKIVIQCHSGNRSAKGCIKLLSDDPNLEVYSLEGGISAWKAAGYPYETSGKSFLPLDRQVQLTIGLMLIVICILGYTVSDKWFALTLIIGAGLSLAGLTGFCGLARIIALMPWNQK